MKNTKRIFALLLAMVMVFAMAITVSARTAVDTKGSILIKNNDTVQASQKTFAAYKAMDLTAYYGEDGKTISTYEYTVPASMVDFYVNRYTEYYENLGENLDPAAKDFSEKVISAIKAETDLFAFAQAVAAAATEEPYTGTQVAAGYQFSELPLGYYAIVDTTEGDYAKPVSAIVVDTATPNVEINVKAEKPAVDKNIDKDNDLGTTNDRVDVNQAAIGDTITYVLESKVPEMIGYKKYYFIMKDQMSKGLTYTNNMVVTIAYEEDGVQGIKTLVEGTDYTLTKTDNEDGTTDLKIVFNNFLQYNNAAFLHQPIVVTYTAELNEDAVLYQDANTNKVYLEYSSNPNVECDGENEPSEEDMLKDPTGTTPEVVVETYTTAIELIKVDPAGKRLTGAEFTLTGEAMNIVRVTESTFEKDENGQYWLLKDGSYTTTDPNSTIEGVPVDQEKYESLTDKYTKNTTVTLKETEAGTVSINGAVGQDGVLRFEGLKAGTYTITELKAPDGYNILDDELTITISFDEENSTFTYAGAVDSNGAARITVVNQIGSELPSTGGIGTTLFYVFGGILLMGAVILLVTKKRMAA